MPTIADIRQQFPQYGDMSDQQLANALHQKFYSDIPQGEFYKKIGLDDGQGADVNNADAAQIAAQFGGVAAGDTSGLHMLDNIARSVANGATLGYADTLAAKMGDLTGIGGEQGQYEKNLQAQKARTAEVPAAVSVPGEVAGTIAAGAATAPITGAVGAATGLAKLPGFVKTILASAGAGGVYASSQAETGKGLDAVPGGAATGAATGALFGLGGKLFGATGDKILASVIRPTAADIRDGFTLDTVKRFDLGGNINTMFDKTQAKLSELSDSLRGKLAQSDQTIDLTKVLDQTNKQLSASNDRLKGFGANKKIAAALENLAGEVEAVPGALSIPDAQIVKQAAGSFGAWQFGRPDPESKASEIVYNVFYNKLKTAIEDASPPGVKDINKDLSSLISVKNALIRRLPVANRNYALSLTDMIGLTASIFDPHALGAFALNLAQKSGTIGSGLSKVGPKMENAPAAALTVGGMNLGSQLPALQ